MPKKKQFVERMAVMGEIFDKELTQALMNIYWEVVKNYDDQEVNAMFEHLLATCRFFPKPADMINALCGSVEDRAQDAWIMVDNAIRQIGTYRSIIFEDPIIAKTIETMGGWEAFGEILEKDWHWHQKEFVKIYKAMNRRKEIGPGKVVGYIERENAGKLMDEFTPEPVNVAKKNIKRLEIPLRILDKEGDS